MASSISNKANLSHFNLIVFHFHVKYPSQLGTKTFNIVEANCSVKKKSFGISYKSIGKKNSRLITFWVSFKSLKAGM